MSEQTVAFQAKIYLFDLENCAREFGFKADEHWEVCLASEAEKKELERKYFPTLAAKLPAEMLITMLGSIKKSLKQQPAESDKNTTIRDIRQQELKFVIAYNAKRSRN
ncbi:hypothetical protein IM792_20950 [Mucilaginibacter sp. JRF]|uniref:hypothetical protein n=1 Tax=Mucilaginibacter sp. JRF TaxID=2780088 RepID=UPI001880F575|nr:hypothetical protein [Mucilaginibacter sp. JRF]MBE9586931.1 hypothetical protein [Mucilaginibacter sp. JRF]